jgi:hypothetical protein
MNWLGMAGKGDKTKLFKATVMRMMMLDDHHHHI